MKKLLLYFATLFLSAAQAQVAIIQTNDRFANIRREPSEQSDIVCQVKQNYVFMYDDESFRDSVWVDVLIPKNDYSFGCSDPDFITGYLEKSKIQPIEKLTVCPEGECTFEYKVIPFSPVGKIMDMTGENLVMSINGRPVWGTDGEVPQTEVKEINAKINGKSINIHPCFYGDIFECDDRPTIYKNGDSYFVYQWNSDGAGAYQLVWVLTKEGLKQRFISGAY